MLDRVGDEVARATSIVRYAPRSAFSSHTHDGGEEFLVLDGVFQDEHGDYPAGTYVRNPPASHHAPRSESGCTIFVKLRQFDLEDDAQIRLDTTSVPLMAVADRPGVGIVPLFRNRHEDVRLEIWSPGATVAIGDRGGIEVLVLEGGFRLDDVQFKTQSWIRLPPGDSVICKVGKAGCKVWVKSGHLDPAFADKTCSPPRNER
ncbi:cupin domain-containing protein [Sphingomonas sp. SE158]|uniref:Cupin domain-containing protein n=2 Tax=Sphingomonas alba TaxID=2908208 RepID=A0ABT0RKT1_9SPHN|nr:cupin domain-containing protein [Sphingomonas alba]